MADGHRTGVANAATLLIGQGTKFVVLILSLLIFSRILEPSDFGIFAVALAMVGVAELFRDAGLTPAAVRLPHLDGATRSNLAWAGLALGLTCAALVALLAAPLAEFGNQAEIEVIIYVLCGIFVLNAIQAPYLIELTRDRRVGALASTEAGAALLGFGVALGAALSGAGYWALVVQQLIGALTLTLSRMACANVRSWGLPRRGASITPLLRYSTALTGAQLLNYASSNVDTMVIGSRVGATTLGYYNRAFQIMTLPGTQILGPLANMALTHLAQHHGTPQFTAAIQRNVVRAGLLGALVTSIMVAASDAGIAIVLGSGWSQVAPYLEILAFGAMFQSLNYVNYWAFLASGNTGALFSYNLVTKGATVLAIMFAVTWGALGVAIAVSICLATSWPIAVVVLRKEFSAFSVAASGFGTILTFAIATAVGVIVAAHAPGGTLIELSLTTAGCGAAWLGVALSVPAQRHELTDIALAICRLLRRRRS